MTIFLNHQLKKEDAAAVAERLFCKKGVPEILQTSQEDSCAKVSFLIKLQA